MIKFWINDSGECKYIDIERPKVDNMKVRSLATRTDEQFRGYVVFEISEEAIQSIKSEKKQLTDKEIMAYKRLAYCQECGRKLVETINGFAKCDCE